MCFLRLLQRGFFPGEAKRTARLLVAGGRNSEAGIYMPHPV